MRPLVLCFNNLIKFVLEHLSFYSVKIDEKIFKNHLNIDYFIGIELYQNVNHQILNHLSFPVK